MLPRQADVVDFPRAVAAKVRFMIVSKTMKRDPPFIAVALEEPILHLPYPRSAIVTIKRDEGSEDMM